MKINDDKRMCNASVMHKNDVIKIAVDKKKVLIQFHFTIQNGLVKIRCDQ